MAIRKIHIALLVAVIVSISCTMTNDKAISPETLCEEPWGDATYANENGTICLKKINDSSTALRIYDNTHLVLDSIWRTNYSFNILPQDSLPFLHYRTSGFKVYENRLMGFDFGGPAYLSMLTGIRAITSKPFWKTDTEVSLSGEIKNSKGGETIEGIYLAEPTGLQNEYVDIKGIITREKFPSEYYSTSDGPQGMFSDTNEAHYRLVLKVHEVKKREKYVYTGSTKNIDGQAAFIWDFADSEAFYLHDQEPWSEAELNKKISIEGVLVQFIDGKSMLMSWRIIE